jgi:hypothetical protein
MGYIFQGNSLVYISKENYLLLYVLLCFRLLVCVGTLLRRFSIKSTWIDRDIDTANLPTGFEYAC